MTEGARAKRAKAKRARARLIWLLASGLVLLAAGGLLTYSAVHFLYVVDPCLDEGGCWDSVDDVCRKAEINAQELCDRARPGRRAD